ncbi:hypothetical protein [Streptomyces sp. TP-A0874]|uniref:hypothetical protein n=1 Tax=Streptomyces sp. TP-A0874 TaxID=549819 RepID=UPI000852B934|nr:hypothetical protein [Streptomyces sp. TP-A0874]
MLALRLARGARPLALLRALLVAAAAGGVGFLLLSSVGHAMAHPGDTDGSILRLLWCLVPLAAVVQLASAMARTTAAGRPGRGLAAAGLGPVRLALLGAVSTALFCTLGSVSALLAFLFLRGDLGFGAMSGSAEEFLGSNRPLPLAASLTLLAAVPLLASAGAALTVRSAPPRSPAGRGAAPTGAPVAGRGPSESRLPAALPWGTAVTAAGLALGAYAYSSALAAAPHGRVENIPPGLVGGWVLITFGLAIACPGLAHVCGRLVAAGRPGATRLLAGRVLQEEAQRIGRPLGVLCSVAAAGIAASRFRQATSTPTTAQDWGPLAALGAGLVLACALVTVLTAVAESRASRDHTTSALRRIGAPAALLRRAAALRAAVLLAVLAPTTWGIAELATMPLNR